MPVVYVTTRMRRAMRTTRMENQAHGGLAPLAIWQAGTYPRPPQLGTPRFMRSISPLVGACMPALRRAGLRGELQLHPLLSVRSLFQ
jgi:hypothetical protein